MLYLDIEISIIKRDDSTIKLPVMIANSVELYRTKASIPRIYQKWNIIIGRDPYNP